jgi:plastocyanin
MRYLIGIVAAAALGACGPGGDHSSAARAEPPPTGTIIQVQMVTDEIGNRFEPERIIARRGDVIHFTLGSGVHGVSFPPERNRSVADLPEPGALMHLAGQVMALPVHMPPGEYTFQCDPHVALGMVGRLTVR